MIWQHCLPAWEKQQCCLFSLLATPPLRTEHILPTQWLPDQGTFPCNNTLPFFFDWFPPAPSFISPITLAMRGLAERSLRCLPYRIAQAEEFVKGWFSCVPTLCYLITCPQNHLESNFYPELAPWAKCPWEAKQKQSVQVVLDLKLSSR